MDELYLFTIISIKLIYLFIFGHASLHVGILVPRPRLKLVPPALEM